MKFLKFFKDLPVSGKITAALLLVITVATINVLVGIYSLNRMNSRLNDIVDVGAEKIKLAARINRNMVEVGRAEKNIVLSTSQEDMDVFAAYTEDYRADLQERLASLRELADDESQQLIDKFEVVWEEYLELNRKVRDLTRENSTRRAFELAFGEGRDKLDTAEVQLDALVDKIDADLKSSQALEVANREERGLAYQKVVLIARIKQNLLAISRAEKNLILAITAEEQQQVFDVLKQEREELAAHRTQLRELVDDEGKQLLDEFAATFEKWRDVNEQVKELAATNEIGKAAELARDVGRPIFDQAEVELDSLAAKIDSELEAIVALQGETAQIFDEANEKVVLIARIKQNLLAMSRAEKNLILAEDEENQKAAMDVFEAEREQLDERRARLRELVDEERQGLLDEFAATIDEWRIINTKVCDLAMADTNRKAIAVSQGAGRETFDKAAVLMGQIVDKNEADLDADKRASDDNFRQAMTNMIVVSVAGIAAGLLLGLLVSRSISTGLNRLVVATDRVAGGDLTQSIQVDTHDEVGILAASFNQMTADLQQTTAQLKEEIAERVRAEEALKEYSEQLEEMVEKRTKELREAQEQLVRRERLAVLGQLAGGVGHELRNPLGAIKNAAYFLNMVIEEPEPDVKETLDILEKEVGTCDRIISSLLDLARPKPLTRRKVDVNEVVQEALSRAAVPDNVEVVSQLDEALPTILADPNQLAQVFGNIILNAVQAMPEGGRLVIASEASGPEWVAVSFTDTGVGIPEENLGKLFEPLFTTKAKGIGLGLALVKTLVEGHGGTIEVESKVGKGSTFTVRLPLAG